MHFLVIDDRFPAPVYVFLDRDPRAEADFPGLAVRRVELGGEDGDGGCRWQGAVAQDPHRAATYHRFASDGAARAAGFGVVEPRYVGPGWADYARAFGFGLRRLSR